MFGLGKKYKDLIEKHNELKINYKSLKTINNCLMKESIENTRLTHHNVELLTEIKMKDIEIKKLQKLLKEDYKNEFNKQVFKEEVSKCITEIKTKTFIESMSDDDLDHFVNLYFLKLKVWHEFDTTFTWQGKYRFIIDKNLIEKFAEFIEVNMKYYEL